MSGGMKCVFPPSCEFCVQLKTRLIAGARHMNLNHAAPIRLPLSNLPRGDHVYQAFLLGLLLSPGEIVRASIIDQPLSILHDSVTGCNPTDSAHSISGFVDPLNVIILLVL